LRELSLKLSESATVSFYLSSYNYLALSIPIFSLVVALLTPNLCFRCFNPKNLK
jgi:hypothetical protein